MTEKIFSRAPNAFKHGAFARTLFIFAGDQEEFERIHESLCQEWQPNGLSEEDCIHTIAVLYFRKGRLPLMLYLQRRKSRNQPVDRILDELLNADPTLDPKLAWLNDKNTSPHDRPELDPLIKRVSSLLGLSRSLFSPHSSQWVEL